MYKSSVTLYTFDIQALISRLSTDWQGAPRSDYNSFIIGPRGLQCETNLK